MLDAHIHLERGPYTTDWVEAFVRTALSRGITEIRLLEHSYLFPAFLPMYGRIRRASPFVDAWLEQKGGKRSLDEYLSLIDAVRRREWPVRIRFGLEVCWFEDSADLVTRLTRPMGLDFLLGSVHFAGDFAFDHRAELWQGRDTDTVYRQYFRHACTLAESGIFDGMAHPNSISLFGHRPSFSPDESYDRLAQKLAEQGMYAEQNSGVRRRCPATAHLGMDPVLLAAMKRHGVRLVTASDAHRPEDVGEGIAALRDTIG